MPSVSVSMDLETIQKVNDFSRVEKHTSLSGAIAHLIKLGFVYCDVLDDQAQQTLEGKQATKPHKKSKKAK